MHYKVCIELSHIHTCINNSKYLLKYENTAKELKKFLTFQNPFLNRMPNKHNEKSNRWGYGSSYIEHADIVYDAN